MIAIKTAQNVTIQYEPASLRDRTMAYFLDSLILVLTYVMLLFLAGALHFTEIFSGMALQQLAMTTPFVLFFAYHAVFEMLNYGQTPGKKAMTIRVVRLDGKDPEWSDVLLRALLHLADSVFCMGVIGALLIKTTARQQRLGDMAANTTVIRLYQSKYNFRLADILKINTAEISKITYPQVRQMTEKDMVFIKNILDRQKKYPNQAHDEAIEDLVTHLMPILGIKTRPADRLDFLKTLLRDYIALTR